MKLKKAEVTKFPFGVRFGRTKRGEILILDFIDQIDEKTSEVFSSLAIDKDLAEKIKSELEKFINNGGGKSEGE